jgi:hypothetical protein
MEQDDGQTYDHTEQQRYEEEQRQATTRRRDDFSAFLFDLLADTNRAIYEAQIGRGFP